MPNNYDIAFTHSHEIQDDGSVKFECSRDIEKWPWLTLPPAHPIVVQTINFWASVETGITRGTFDPTKWSALTFAHWETGAEFTGPVIRGLADTPPGEPDIEKPHYRLTFFDAAGNLVCRIVGTGVIFKTRNFEAWRGKAKEKADLSHSIKHFTFAPAESLGVNSDVERFLSPLSHGDRVTAGALVTDRKRPYAPASLSRRIGRSCECQPPSRRRVPICTPGL